MRCVYSSALHHEMPAVAAMDARRSNLPKTRSLLKFHETGGELIKGPLAVLSVMSE